VLLATLFNAVRSAAIDTDLTAFMICMFVGFQKGGTEAPSEVFEGKAEYAADGATKALSEHWRKLMSRVRKKTWKMIII
jgi:hypothetical protein